MPNINSLSKYELLVKKLIEHEGRDRMWFIHTIDIFFIRCVRRLFYKKKW